MTDLATALVERLASGTWVKIDHLARDLDSNRRDIEAAIEEARLAGQPIIAGTFGVRLTDDPDVLEGYVHARRERLVSIWLGTRALRRTARRMRDAQASTEGLTLWGAK